MSTAQAEPEIGGSGTLCTQLLSILRGKVEHIQACETEPSVFWILTCDGPVQWTAQLFELTGNQEINGLLKVHQFVEIDDYLGLKPTEAPAAPATGCRIYIDATDNHLKVKFSDPEALFELNSNQKVYGYLDVNDYIGLLPITQPAAPATGCRIYIDATDNHLKVKFSNNTVKTIETP